MRITSLVASTEHPTSVPHKHIQKSDLYAYVVDTASTSSSSPPSHVHTHTHRYLVSIGCIKPLCDMLTVQDSRIVLVTLEGLENILKVGQLDVRRNGGVNPYSVLIEEAFGVWFVCDVCTRACICPCLAIPVNLTFYTVHEVICRQTRKVVQESKLNPHLLPSPLGRLV